MARWLTPKRILVYGAYFTGAFSLIVGLFVGKHAWHLHGTIKLIEKSWDRRNISHSDVSWVSKAYHAILAGHEEVGQYNDLYWDKRHQLQETGCFDRANLKQSDDCRPEWAETNAAYDKWGFVLYRTYYGDADWNETLQFFNHSIRSHLEVEATGEGQECDPELVRDRATLEVIEDRELLEDATIDQVRALWRKRVGEGLVDRTFKTGGWKYGGWFRVNLPGNEMKKPNGMALNLCMMYNHAASTVVALSQMGVPATGPRDPWEPFLVAVDGLWDPREYMYLTSWAEGYEGIYAVSLSLLMNSFHGAVYEREPERSAPHMSLGGAYIDRSLPLWRQLALSVFGTPAVARPGRFPFHNRYLEQKYPFVREDSWWAAQNDTTTEKAVEDPQRVVPDNSDAMLEGWHNAISPPVVYTLCLESDDPADCFHLGNLHVRIPERALEAGEQEDKRGDDAESIVATFETGPPEPAP